MNVWRTGLGLAAAIALAQRAGTVQAEESPMSSSVGATVPWVTYEAESAKTNGTVIGPEYGGQSATREASNRRCVKLSRAGQYLEFQADGGAQGLVVRYSIPDTSDGRGANATLSLYINGQKQPKLSMTSRFAYLYGAYPYNNNPASGTPRHFWDELRVMPGEIHAGDVIRLEKDADDRATQYLIDFVDLESVPAPLARPTDAVSVADFGAVPNDAIDDHAAFVAAIASAKVQHKSVWIPPGKFVVKGAIKVSDVAIHGAGMWYSTLIGVDDYTSANRVAVYGDGSNITLSDFAIDGKLNYRNDEEPNDGIGGSYGTGSTIRNIWVEHTKTGGWITNSDGLIVEGCRFRDTIADGINLCIGMRNTTVRNCTARGGGDDCFAMWPAVYAKSNYTPGGNRFVNCTGQLPFLAQAFSVYGGDSNTVENCRAIDIPYGAGLFASTTFPTEFGFRGTTRFSRCITTRCGDADGAIGVVANLVNLASLRFDDIDLIDSPTDGIRFTSIKDHTLADIELNRVRIVNPGVGGEGYGIVAVSGATGSATISNVSIAQAKSGGFKNDSPAFKLISGVGNLGVVNSGVDDSPQSSAHLAAARREPASP